MESWHQYLYAALIIAMLFFIWPSVKTSIARSKNAEEKHWVTFALIVLALIAFIYLLISSVQ